MAEYEVLIETINPCGGPKHATREFTDVETDDPVTYVHQHGRFPILESNQTPDGDLVITTGDGAGNLIRYVFSR